jgi:hypothetical protein
MNPCCESDRYCCSWCDQCYCQHARTVDETDPAHPQYHYTCPTDGFQKPAYPDYHPYGFSQAEGEAADKAMAVLRQRKLA